MTKRQIDDLGLMINKLECAAAVWLGKAHKSGSVKETAILEEVSWMIGNVKIEFELGNFMEARVLYENAEWLVSRSIARMTTNN